MTDYTELRTWATPRQLELIDAIKKHGTETKAAKALGLNKGGVSQSMRNLRKRAARMGWAPGHFQNGVAPGYLMGKVTVQRDAGGNVVQTWERQSPEWQEQEALLRSAIEALKDDIPSIPIAPEPLNFQDDIIPWLQIGDAHIGMLAHASETSGESFDLKIAERELCTAISMLIDEMPNCERMVINDLGDATHYQNFSAISESGHSFDIDGRLPKMLRVYSRTMRFIIDRALTKAKFVDVIINQGNHSRVNDFWMRELLSVAYAGTKRVQVLDNDNVFIGYRMGNTFVMVHHSDKCKPDRLIGVMTSDFRKDFGETSFHYVDVGHVHHHFVSREHPSVVIESWNHLAANDKWAHDSGYRARKAISIVLRSKTYGEVGRRMLPIEAIKDRLHQLEGHAPSAKRVAYSV